jgi:predicted lactoylglutathione lyase
MPAELVECTIPVLPVRHLALSIEFYTTKLGFQVDWGGNAGDRIGSVSRDGRSIMLMESSVERTPAWVWIGIDDASWFDVLRSQGVEVVQEPRNCSWAYEMKFADLDGNVLWMGAEPKPDLPFADAAS